MNKLNTNPTHDFYISYTDAAYILGYKTYRSILTLIKEGHIQTYQIAPKSRKYLKLKEVMNVATPQIISALQPC